jgi:Carboxypeptidase regulatory-like domain
MRAATEQRLLDVDPGTTTCVVVDLVNNGDVIDGISANVIGLAAEFVHSRPELLPLFPATAGQLTVSLAIPPEHPAGRHPLTVELISHGAHLPPQYLDVDLNVSARPSLQIAPVPRMVQARRTGRFVIELTNDGNVPLDVSLEAVDVDRSMSATFTPPRTRVEAGSVVPVLLHLRGPRMFTGAPAERPLKVVATAEQADLPGEPEPGTVGLGEPRTTSVKLRQRPLLSRGMLTALILMTIVGVWATVFLLGLTKVFSNDPMTKAAPASFYMSAKKGAAAQGITGGSGALAAAPPGALAKSGQVVAGIGGEIGGTVTAKSDGSPVGRILVQAYRMGRDGIVPVGSAATQSDGTYTVAGLFPTDYFLKFSGTGFTPMWYPNSPTQQGAHSVAATAQGSTSGVNIVVKGAPATISGTVDAGDTLTTVHTQVVAYSLTATGTHKKVGQATTHGANGAYEVPNLDAPGRYQLVFTTPGYQASSLVDTVAAGDKRIEPLLNLDAAVGSISGVVKAGGQLIGGATVATTVNGKAVSVVTPTTGLIGTFALANLPTPATYVITISEPAHGSITDIVDLTAGQSFTKAKENLTGGGGTISGRVFGVGPDKAGLGGVTVTVGGAVTSTGVPSTTGIASTTTPSTVTLTDPGSEGKFAVNGLPDGLYTLTFAADGYAPTSVRAVVDSKKPPGAYGIHLIKNDGSIAGQVYYTTNEIGSDGTTQLVSHAIQAATVNATDGKQVWTATTNTVGTNAGGYRIAQLPPGTYTVTATALGYGQLTRIVHVDANQKAVGKDLHMVPAA